jgi:hypothetical protein
MPNLASLLALALLFSTSSLHAQAAAPAEPNPQRVLRLFAEHERDARRAGGFSLLIGAAAAIPTGLVADRVYDQGYGQVLWIAGTLAAVSGVTSLFLAGPFERLARDAEAFSPSQLESEWSQRARAARLARHIGGVVGISLGVLMIGAGASIAAGLGDLEREPKHDWTTVLIALGGAVAGQGVASLLLESPFESSHRIAYGTEPAAGQALSVRVGPTLGGAAMSVRASF